MTDLIRVDQPDFPYRIGRAGEKASSRIVISRLNNDAPGTSTLAYVDGGEFITRESRDRVTEGRVQLRHPFARDIEGDPVYIADFTIDWVMFNAASAHRVRFSGILKEARFYVDPQANPLAALAPSAAHTDDAIGLPYQPPRVQFAGVQLPIEVNVSVEYGFSDYSITGNVPLLS